MIAMSMRLGGCSTDDETATETLWVNETCFVTTSEKTPPTLFSSKTD
jgi:hypothetical protein